MVNKIKFLILTVLIFSSQMLFAQSDLIRDVRVSVLPLWYDQENETVGPVLSEVVQSTIQWTLQFINEYELVEKERYPKGQSELPRFIKSNNLDNIIYGRVDADFDTLEYTLSLILLDTKTDKVAAIKQGTVVGSREIFDLADVLSVALLEEFIGRELEFGSFSFVNNGTADGFYEVYINDILLGQDLQDIDRFLIGDYNMRIVHVSGEDRLNIYDEIVSVKADEETRIEFSLDPYGYAVFKHRGAFKKHTILRDGKPILFPGYNKKIPLPMGTAEYKPLMKSYDPQHPFSSDSIQMTVGEGEPAQAAIKILKPGRSVSFYNKGEEGSYLVVIDGEEIGTNIESIPVLGVGARSIEIYRGDQRDRENLFLKQTLVMDRYKDREIFFELPSESSTVKTRYKLASDFSVELQTMYNGIIWAGAHYLFLDNHMGAAALAGFSVDGDKGHLLLQAKLHGLPFKERMFSPYAGGSFFLDTDFSDVEILLGPHLGVSWKTDWNIISSVFIETGLFYSFTDSRFHFRFGLGSRLF